MSKCCVNFRPVHVYVKSGSHLSIGLFFCLGTIFTLMVVSHRQKIHANYNIFLNVMSYNMNEVRH